jgi:chromate transporter
MPLRTPVRRTIIVSTAVVTLVLMGWDLATESSIAAWIFVVLAVGAILLFVRRFRRLSSIPLPADAPGAESITRVPALRELFRESLTLGTIGFGGGLAVLSQIELRLVVQKRWIKERLFLESAALAQSLPGAVATNALSFIGYRLAGLPGALAAIIGFVLPSFLLLLVFALVYPWLRGLPLVEGLFFGLNPAVGGLVAATAVRLGGQAVLDAKGRAAGWRGLVRDRLSFLVVLASCLGVAVFGLGVVEVIGLAGLFGIFREISGPLRAPFEGAGARWRWLRWRARRTAREGARLVGPWWRRLFGWRGDTGAMLPWLLVAEPLLGSLPARLQALGAVSGVFLRAGALTFGGGFVMIPLLEAELVRGQGWLTPHAFADAMALGQITPGPVVITATFVGYRISGLSGALFATVSVFLPAFLMMLLVAASVDRFRKNRVVQGFLHGIQPAVVGLMFAAAWVLMRHGVGSYVGMGVAVASFIALWRWQVTPVWVLLGACVVGVFARLAGL